MISVIVTNVIKRVKKDRAFYPVLSIIFAAVLHIPVFIWLVGSWLDDPSYYHGFVIPIISASIFWLRRKHLQATEASLAGVIIIIAGLALYVTSFVWTIQFLSAISFIIIVLGILVFFSGTQKAKLFVFPTLFLVFMVPMPFLDRLSAHLQTVTTHLSAAMAGWVGIETTITGNQITTAAGNFIIDTPCSGINSLISLLALAAIIGFIAGGSLFNKIVLFALAFPIAIIVNNIRVTLTLVVAAHWGVEAAMDYFHGISNLVLFILAVAFLTALARLLLRRFRTLTELANG